MSNRFIIALDFEGTLVDHCFPDIGKQVPHAFPILIEIQKKYSFIKYILHTCRENNDYGGSHRNYLDEAADYCRAEGLDLWAVNERPDHAKIHGMRRKPHADLYIDERGICVPLMYLDGFRGALVNWFKLKPVLYRRINDHKMSMVKMPPLV